MTPLQWGLLAGLVLVLGWMIFRKKTGVAPGGSSMIQAAELLERIKQPAPPYLLDVREPMELKTAPGVLPGVVNIPLGTLAQRFAEVPKDRDVVVICRSGARSSQAYLFLQQKGYTRLRNLAGGMLAVQALPRA